MGKQTVKIRLAKNAAGDDLIRIDGPEDQEYLVNVADILINELGAKYTGGNDTGEFWTKDFQIEDKFVQLSGDIWMEPSLRIPDNELREKVFKTLAKHYPIVP
jgi:hypothetical protein